MVDLDSRSGHSCCVALNSKILIALGRFDLVSVFLSFSPIVSLLLPLSIDTRGGFSFLAVCALSLTDLPSKRVLPRVEDIHSERTELGTKECRQLQYSNYLHEESHYYCRKLFVIKTQEILGRDRSAQKCTDRTVSVIDKKVVERGTKQTCVHNRKGTDVS